MRHKTILVLNALAVLALAGGLSGISFAQSTKQDRIVGPIAGSPAVWLEGNTRPMFRPENDLGPVDDSLKLENITLAFKPTAEQQANLEALLDDQQNPSSPLYHHWLTPEQFADSFGLSANDLAQVVTWLQSQGFTVTYTARSRTWVFFSGTAAQVRAAFQTEIHNYSLDGQTYYANSSEPAVPAVLADVVLGVTSLDNYHARPLGVFRQVSGVGSDVGSGVAPGFSPALKIAAPPSGTAPESAGLKPGATPASEATPASQANPEFTSYLSSKNFVTPGDFAVIYDLNPLYTTVVNGNPINGTGEAIAVMGETDISTSDITTFRTVSGLTPINLKVVVAGSDPGTSSNTGIIDEAALDIEWSGAVAPGATIYYVNSNDAVGTSLPYAIDNVPASVMSVSYGLCEPKWTNAQLNSLSLEVQHANTNGITVIAAAGDEGAADCDYSSSTTTIITSATHGLAVDAPASVPYVTGMGGSEFAEGGGNYWQTAPNNADVLTSALFYIPETVWNDTTTTNGLLAGGGGVSTYFQKPTWQTGTGVPNDGYRDVPDLSLNASPAHDSYLICVQGSCVNNTYRNPNNPTLANALSVAGGTSAAAPTFAGIVALIDQYTGSRQGNINLTLYSMAANAPAAFHDITTGSNIVPCTNGTTSCPATAPFQFGYSAGVGYDQASGLGSVDAYNLVTMWGSPATGNLPAPTLSTPALGATAVTSPVSFTWSQVSNNNGYRLFIATSPAALTTNPLTSTCSQCSFVEITPVNTNSFNLPSSLATNTLYYWQVQAVELPVPGGGTAAWSNVFVFNTGTPDFTLSGLPSTLSISPGSTTTPTLTVSPVSGFLTNTLVFSCAVGTTLVGVTCTVGSLGGNDQATVTITASSTATSYPALPRNPGFGAWWTAGVALLGLLLLALWRRRLGGPSPAWNLRQVALGAALATLFVASLSCGGGSSGGGGGGGGGGTQTETGTITVTGTPTSVTGATIGTAHSATINVTVS
jgi:subtilase family serine protease